MVLVLNHSSSEYTDGPACWLAEPIVPLAPSNAADVSLVPETAPGWLSVTPPVTMPSSSLGLASWTVVPDASPSLQ